MRGGGLSIGRLRSLKRSLTRRLVSTIYFKITKAALNHVNDIESITSDPVGFDFIGFTGRVEIIIVTAVVNIGHVVQFLLSQRN